MRNRIEEVRRLYHLLTIVFVAAILPACKDKSSSPTVPVVPDTTFTSQPQVDTPWPGLANSPWPMFLHDPQHTGRSPYRGPQFGQVEWLFDAGRNVYSSPAIDQVGNIYFSALGGNFFCVSPAGSLVWQYSGGGGDSNPLISSDGTIYISGDTTLYAYNPNGSLKWKVCVQLIFGKSDKGSPVISKDGNTIFVPHFELLAIRKDGTIAWRLHPDSSDSFGDEPAFSIDGTTLYVSGWNRLYAIDTSGVIKWRFPCNPSSVAVDNAGNLYFASQIKLYSLTPSGTVRWIRDTIFTGGFDVGPSIGRDGSIYLTGSFLYAFDNVGKLRWKYSLSSSSGSIPAIDLDGTIYFGVNTSRNAADSINFIALNPNGTVKFRASLRSPDNTVPDIDSHPAISSDGKIYVGSDRPRGVHLYKIR